MEYEDRFSDTDYDDEFVFEDDTVTGCDEDEYLDDNTDDGYALASAGYGTDEDYVSDNDYFDDYDF
jgi:hypothetical protein